jgi:hypothetical protein
MPQKQQNQCRLQPLCNSVGKKMSFQQTVKLCRPMLLRAFQPLPEIKIPGLPVHSLLAGVWLPLRRAREVPTSYRDPNGLGLLRRCFP